MWALVLWKRPLGLGNGQNKGDFNRVECGSLLGRFLGEAGGMCPTELNSEHLLFRRRDSYPLNKYSTFFAPTTGFQYSILLCIRFRCTTWWLDNQTLPCVLPPIFSAHLAPSVVITILMTTSICCKLYPHDYFVTANLYLSSLSSFSPSPPNPLPETTTLFCVYESVSVLFAHL